MVTATPFSTLYHTGAPHLSRSEKMKLQRGPPAGSSSAIVTVPSRYSPTGTMASAPAPSLGAMPLADG
jgi:hypothetical protein